MQNWIYVRNDQRYVRLSSQDILFIEARGKSAHIICKNETLVCRVTITKLLNLLPVNCFCRIHRSFIISLNALDAFDGHYAYLNDHKVAIGAQFKQHLLDQLIVLQQSRNEL